ncbi:MAG: hypothetical protein GQ582_01905 [Methyloprofundus sp.]|nr:hypothetical protein [Methyloprofundus sp.]
MKIIKLFHLTAFLILLSGFYSPLSYAGACGGVAQRACCIGEREGLSCDSGLIEAALGEYPNGCGFFAAGTCLPITAKTECGGEGQRSCCLGEGAACDAGLEYQTDALPLDLYEAVSGDASCSGNPINGTAIPRSLGTCVKSEPLAIPTSGDIAEPTTGWSSTSSSRGIMSGYMDMHIHLFGHMGHGSKVLSGEPAPIDEEGNFVLDDTYNVNTALSPAKDLEAHKSLSHGLLNDTAGDGTQDGARSWYGAPYFNGWPKWTSTTHQQMYYVWLERAWRGGLRAATMLAVHNEALCKTSLKSTRKDSWPLCEDSMSYIIEQLKAAYKFEEFIDGLSGGVGKGWFRIVTTPEQARDEIAAGNLAVILGIEVDNLFNCKEINGCPTDFGLPLAEIEPLTNLPQPTTIEEAVNVLHDMGVRHIFPVHNFDNGFGGAATWMDSIAVGQAVAQQRWWKIEECAPANDQYNYGYWVDNGLAGLMVVLGFGPIDAPAVPDYSATKEKSSCNIYGLKSAIDDNERHPGGERLLKALMNRGMLIDIDHMSIKSLDQTIALSKTNPGSSAEPYPLLASHVQFFSLHHPKFSGNKGRHERMRTREQLNEIKAGGGMIAAMLKDDVQDTDLKGDKYTRAFTNQKHGGEISDNCRHSSKTFAQALQYATDVMDGPVALGSDFNGMAGHLGPRFGSDACGGWRAIHDGKNERLKQVIEDNKVDYPFTLSGYGKFAKQKTGFKEFDYNVDGLAHVGLLPDMVQDLKEIGLDSHYLSQLFCSAEAYVRVWERAEAFANGAELPDLDRAWQCNAIDISSPTSQAIISTKVSDSGWYRDNVRISIKAFDEGTGIESIKYNLSYVDALGTSRIDEADIMAGDTVILEASHDGLNTLSFSPIDKAGNDGEYTVLEFKIDRTLPALATNYTPKANSAGWNNTPVFVISNCMDEVSGLKLCGRDLFPPTSTVLKDVWWTTHQILMTEGINQSISTTAVDHADNSVSTKKTGINIDRTLPTITSGRAVANSVGWNNSAVSILFACADTLSGIKSCTPSQSITTEGANQSISGIAVDNADNRAVIQVTGINIDTTLPQITSRQTPLATVDGWNNSAVLVSFACTDQLSGIKSCTSNQTLLTTEGENQSISGIAVDRADNQVATTATGINIDITPPIVTVIGVTEAAVYTPDSVPAVTCHTSDALSGVAVNATLSVTGGSSNGTGTFTASCHSARDVAGNTSLASVSYKVHYPFGELLASGKGNKKQPIVRAGRIVPLKFDMNGDFGLDILQEGSPTSVKINCATADVEGEEEIAVTLTPGNSVLNYSPESDLYHYNWKTEKSWAGTCRRLLLTLNDGTIHSADVRFREGRR